jgi:hypothetical protein
MQAWGVSPEPLPWQQQEEEEQQQRQSMTCWLLRQAVSLAHPGALRAAAVAIQLLLSGMPLACLEDELFAVREAPALLLQLQGRLDPLGDSSLLEGVVALVLRCTPEAVPAAAAAKCIRGDVFSWSELFRAAQRVQPQAVQVALAGMREAQHSMPVLLAGVRIAAPLFLRRLSDMLSSRTDDSRQQILGIPELPGAITIALGRWAAAYTQGDIRDFVPRLLDWPELVCSSQELQEAVVAMLGQYGRSVGNNLAYKRVLQVSTTSPPACIPCAMCTSFHAQWHYLQAGVTCHCR